MMSNSMGKMRDCMTDRSDPESWQDEGGGCHACLIGRTVVGVGWTKVDTTSSHSGSVHASVIQHHRTHGFFGAVRDGPGHALHCILRRRLVISQFTLRCQEIVLSPDPEGHLTKLSVAVWQTEGTKPDQRNVEIFTRIARSTAD